MVGLEDELIKLARKGPWRIISEGLDRRYQLLNRLVDRRILTREQNQQIYKISKIIRYNAKKRSKRWKQYNRIRRKPKYTRRLRNGRKRKRTWPKNRTHRRR